MALDPPKVTRPRPFHPAHAEKDWSILDVLVRRSLLDIYYIDNRNWWAEQAGLRILPDYVEGAQEFCVECYACSSPGGVPVRGKDSHGDCAEDGETIYWAVPLLAS